MERSESSDWGQAFQLVADGPPAAMSPEHLRRARAHVAGYVAVAVLGTLLAFLPVANARGSALLAVALAAVVVITAVAGAATGRLADWTRPLKLLSPADAQAVRDAIFPRRGHASEATGPFPVLLSKQFLWGSTLRVVLAVELAMVFALLSMRFINYPPLSLSVAACGVLNLIIAALEVRRRVQAAHFLRTVDPYHQG